MKYYSIGLMYEAMEQDQRVHASRFQDVCVVQCQDTPKELMEPVFQDPPYTLNWGDMVPDSGYLGPNKG